MRELCKSRINSKYLVFQIKRFRVLIAIFTVLFSATFPIPLFLRKDVGFYDHTMIGFLVFLLFVTTIISMIVPFMYFSYLFSKNSVDTYHSLPIRRRDLYITNIVASFFTVLIPFTIAYFSGYLVAFLRFNEVFDTIFGTYELFTFIRLSVLILSIIIATTYVIMNIGTLSDAIIYTGLLFVLPFLAFVAIQFFADSYIVGYTFNSVDILSLISPHFSLFEVTGKVSAVYRSDAIASYWFLVSIVLSAITVTIYNRRPSEKTEEPFTNRYFFTIVTSVFTGIFLVALISLWTSFSYYEELLSLRNLTIPVIISGITYFILNIIKNRSTKGSIVTLRNFLIVSGVTFAFCYTVVITDGFGYVYRIPSQRSIEQVELNQGYLSDFPYFLSSGKPMVIKDSKNIETFMTIHRNVLDAYKEDHSSIALSRRFNNSYNFNDYTTFSFSYTLNGGTKVKRSYTVKKALISDLVAITLSKEQIQENPFFDPKFSIQNVNFFNGTMTKEYSFKGSYKDLTIHFLKDAQSIDEEDYSTQGNAVRYAIKYRGESNQYWSSGYLVIDDRMTETLAYLNDNLELEDDRPGFTYYAVDSEDVNPDLLTNNGLYSFSYTYIPDYMLQEKNKVSKDFLETMSDKTCGLCYGTKDLSYILVENNDAKDIDASYVIIPFFNTP